jgi:general secretion pathway protein F
MQTYRYRAMTQSGELVNGSISAPSASEVAHRIEYLGLVPIETVAEEGAAAVSRATFALFNRPRAEDVTIFTRDLALLLKAGARLDDALGLLADDRDIGRLRAIVGKIRTGILSGESFAEAVAQYPEQFPSIYVALVQVGETSGKLPGILEMLANDRMRSEALRRKVTDALQYPAFLLLAASGVLMFFILFVLPKFASVLRDFNAKTDSMITTFIALSDFMHEHDVQLAVLAAAAAIGGWTTLRRPALRAAVIGQIARIPGISSVFNFYRTALFCRNLGILLGSDVTLTATLRILVDIMSVTGRRSPWLATADRVRHGGKLSDALAASALLPAMAIRMLRIGEETGQLPTLAGRVADFYEAKLQRSLDRVIVSVMTALLSISQIVG